MYNRHLSCPKQFPVLPQGKLRRGHCDLLHFGWCLQSSQWFLHGIRQLHARVPVQCEQFQMRKRLLAERGSDRSRLSDQTQQPLQLLEQLWLHVDHLRDKRFHLIGALNAIFS
jgi:hypothetical protein